MRASKTLLIMFMLAIAINVISCSDKMPQTLGVFANADKGLIELSIFGEQVGSTSYKFRADPLKWTEVLEMDSFVVNMPDVKIMSSEVYWTKNIFDFDPSRPPRGIFKSQRQEFLKAEIQSIKNNVYKITCSEMKKDSYVNGWFVLKIGMPFGTADRVYPIAKLDKQTMERVRGK